MSGCCSASLSGAAAGARRGRPARLLTTIKDIRALSQDEAARGYPVRIRGIVTHFDEVQKHDADRPRRRVRPVRHAPAERARASGLGRSRSRRPDRDRGANRARRIRAERRPPTRPHARAGAAAAGPNGLRISAMLTGRHDCDYVEVVGVIQRAWLSSDPRSHMHVRGRRDRRRRGPRRVLGLRRRTCTRFIDARVRLRGNIGTLFGRTEQLRGVSLFVGHDERHRASSSRRPIRSRCPPARSGASTTTRPPARSTAASASAASSPPTFPATPWRCSDFTTHGDVPLRRQRALRERRNRRRADRDRAASRAARRRSSKSPGSRR